MATLLFDIPDQIAQELYQLSVAYIKAYLRDDINHLPDLDAIKNYAEQGQQGQGGNGQ